LNIGDIVTVEIDTLRRAKLSTLHSVTHIILMGIEKFFPGMEKIFMVQKLKKTVSD